MTNLNPDKPPSAYAMRVLDSISRKPMPKQEVNFTVGDKLFQYGLIDLVEMPSPYKTHRYEKTGRRVTHMVITELGRAALEKASA